MSHPPELEFRAPIGIEPRSFNGSQPVLMSASVPVTSGLPAPDIDPHEPGAPRVLPMYITPETAQKWLGMPGPRRPVRDKKVAEFARDMKAGNWLLNGETIKIAPDGGVVDGIHRLKAVTESCATIYAYVAFGVPWEAQITVDTGSSRLMSDQLHLAGDKNAIVLAAVAKRVWRWLEGYRSSGGPAPTHTEMALLIAQCPLIIEATEYAMHARGRWQYVRASTYGVAYFVFSERASNVAAVEFLDMVVKGAGLEEGHPVLALRDRTLRASRRDQASLSEHEQLALMIMAWNAWRQGRTLTRMVLPKNGLKHSNFPDPVK